MSASPPISWFPTVDNQTMDPRAAAMAEKAESALGFVPNVFKVWGWRPDRLVLWRAYYDNLLRGPGGLSFAEREMIACVVSAENHCLYCLSSHGYQLRVLLGDPVLAERIAIDYRRAGLDQRHRAMLDFVVKLTHTPEECGEADLAALQSVGFSETDCWDIIEIASMFNLTNRVAAGAGMLPNPEYHGLAR